MTTDQSTTILIEVLTEVEALSIVNVLQEKGITATQVGALTAGMRTETVGTVQVLVKSCDLEKANATLIAYQEALKNIDWDDVDLGEAE